MNQKLTKYALWVVPALFLCLAVAPQYTAAQTASAPAVASQTVTGCLQKGLEPGGFFLFTGKDQHWELYENANVSLADHVGQTIAVTGTVPARTPAQEEKSQNFEKKETGDRKHSDFQVTAVKVVSPTCKK